MSILLCQALLGAVKVFVFIGLPFVLLSYAFGLMAGERMEYAKFANSCLKFMSGMIRSILRGVAALSSFAARSLPTKYAKYRLFFHVAVHLFLLNAVFWVLLTSLAKFAQAE